MRTSAAAATPATSVLVVLSLRGAADGLSLVVPHADPVYYRARPRLAIPADRLLVADAQFGLHPALAPAGPPVAVGPRWRPSTPPGCRCPTAPTSPRWRRSRTPTRARPPGWAGSTACIGTDAGQSPLQGLAVGDEPAAHLALRPRARDVGRRPRRGRDRGRGPVGPRRAAPVAADPVGRRRRAARPGAGLRRSPPVDDFGPGAGDQRDAGPRRGVPRRRPGPRDGRGGAGGARRRGRRGDHRRPGRLGHALRPRHRRQRPDGAQRRRARLGGGGVLHRPGSPGRQGHAGHAQRVRSARRRERQHGPRPRSTAT